MATPILSNEECYSDEDDFFGNEEESGSSEESGLSGWQLAARGVQMAINNRVEEAQELLRVDSSCIHRQAGFCYLSFIVSLNLCIIFGWDSARVKFEKKCNLGKPHGFPYSKSDNLFAISIS